MKIITPCIIALFVLISQTQAQSTVIKISGTRFPYEIMQQWIDVYHQSHPDLKFELSKSIPADSADIYIQAHGFRDGELKDEQVIVALNRYAQLPIVNSNRSDLKALQQKGFTKSDLQKIYFNQTADNDFHVYKRDKKVCASRSFAENVTGSQLDVAGRLVNGDDRALSAAVKNDVEGISYNNLGLIYNLKTRKVADSIAIIPIDLNENGKIDANENIYATLDDVLNFLASSNNTIIPEDNVNVVINKNATNKNVVDFLSFIITEGQQYNKSFSFLSLDKTVVLNEQKLLQTISNDNALAK